MSLKEVFNQKCLFCEQTVTGSQEYMLGGRNLPGHRGPAPRWLKERPEWEWVWNGLDETEFYLCPEHSDQAHYNQAFRWCEEQNKLKKSPPSLNKQHSGENV